MQPHTFIFVGRSGSGKGTQLELLKKYLAEKDPAIAQQSLVMGDIFRGFFKESGYMQDVAREVTNSGKFQPDFLTNALFINRAVHEIKEFSHLFLDGYPRSISQLSITKEFLVYVKRMNPIVLNINVSADAVRARMLSRGRADDSSAAVESRLSEYERTIVPMLEAIKKDSFFTYIEIDGEPAPEIIQADIIQKLAL